MEVQMLANVNFTYIKSPEMRPLRKWSKTPEKSQYVLILLEVSGKNVEICR